MPSLFWWRKEETEEYVDEEAPDGAGEEVMAETPVSPKEVRPAPEKKAQPEKTGADENMENMSGKAKVPSVTVHPVKQAEQPRRPAPVVQTQREAPTEIVTTHRPVSRTSQENPIEQKVVEVKETTIPQKDATQTETSDCEMYLKKWCEIARKRNSIYMERMQNLEKLQREIEADVEKIKTNPITLRAMSDLDNKTDINAVRKEAARRRADTFSNDSTSISEYLRLFESRLSSWLRMTHLALEVAMLAPLPELGRHVALLKNVRIFLDTVGKNDELKIYASETSNISIHDRIVAVNSEMEALFKKAFEVLDQFCRAKEQPIDFNMFKKSDSDCQDTQPRPQKQRPQQAQRQPQPRAEPKKPAPVPEPGESSIIDDIEYAVADVAEEGISIPGAVPTGKVEGISISGTI